MVIGRFCALFRHGPHGGATSPKGSAQRGHGVQVEEQEATELHVARNGRPIPTVALHAAKRTVHVVAKARSGEIDHGVLAGVGPEVPTKVGRKVAGFFRTLHVELGRIVGIQSCSGEPREDVIGR